VIEWLIERIEAGGDRPAVGTPSVVCTYWGLAAEIATRRATLARAGVGAGAVVSLEGDYGPASIASFLALAAEGAIIVPLSSDSAAQREALLETAQVEARLDARSGRVSSTGRTASHGFYDGLRSQGHPGLVLFTSGSTGTHKGAVHDLTALLEKFRTQRNCYRTIVFLQIDHIGGVNTLLYTLANGGMSVAPADRSPEEVCRSIARHRVELLPTSPTFLNLLLLSEAYQRHDVSSLRLVTYGTEPMPESTLERLAGALPGVDLLQTYGSTELGILRSKSRSRDSLWVRVGGEGYETRIVNGRLRVRARAAMLGYLNAPSPFDEEGFIDTGDLAESDGEWIRILGRQSEVINVGGSKVHPAEVESVLLMLDNVVDASVRGEPHPIVGHIVCATVQLSTEEAPADFRTRARRYCSERLAAYKVPVRITITDAPIHSVRFKRMRRVAPQQDHA
jgi:long-chain acyl-CoA synthetase